MLARDEFFEKTAVSANGIKRKRRTVVSAAPPARTRGIKGRTWSGDRRRELSTIASKTGYNSPMTHAEHYKRCKHPHQNVYREFFPEEAAAIRPDQVKP